LDELQDWKVAAWLGKSQASYRGRPGFIQAQSVCDLWWTKWHWDRSYLTCAAFPIQYHSSILIFILTLLLSGGETGEAWEPSIKIMLFTIWGEIWKKM